jgi:hypothetical protein
MTRKLSTDAKTTLGEILCDTDILWTPFRTRRTTTIARDAAIVERRELFQKSGLVFATGGSSTARSRDSRAVAELAARKLVTVGAHGRNRTVRLTPAGDNYARSFLPSCRIDESWPVLEKIAAAEAAFDGRSNAGFIREFEILGIDNAEPADDHARQLVELEDRALPLLAAGLIESCSDAEGTLGYRTTDAGREMLAAGQPSTPSKMPVYDATRGRQFTNEYNAGLHERDLWKPAIPNHVWIPLSAGMWPARKVGEHSR